MFNTTIEFCTTIENLPPLFKVMFDIFKKYSNNLVHPCPYVPAKKIGVIAMPFDGNDPTLALANFLPGDYKGSFICKDQKGKLIFFIDIYISMSTKKFKG